MAKTLKTATKIVFGNKEKKQFPDPEGLEREKPSSAIEGSTHPLGSETNRSRNKFSEAAPPMPGAKQTLNSRIQRVGSVRRGVSLAAPRKEEVDGNMENKTFTQFVTEAKRGRPRKLRPGEKADTEHLQDQLSKLTHPNHVIVHFADGTKHQIPRGHANKALQKLASLKPEHRAAHVEHMHSSHENFYKTLAGHPIPSKKKTITLAGPKLRKEETEVEEDYDPEAATWSKKFADNARFAKSQSKADHLYARINPEYKKEKEKEAKSYTKKSKDAAKKAITGMDEEAEHDDDGWYAHKEMHGKDAVSREDWKKGIRKKPAVKKEEVESDEKKKKDHHKLLQKFRHRIDEIKAIKGTHATKLHAAKVIHPDKVGYAGKQTKPKVQNLRREDYAPLEAGEKQTHVDQKTADAKSRKQGAEKPKKPKMEMTKEAWALYDTLSDKNKAIFEKMDAAERDALVDKYISGKR